MSQTGRQKLTRICMLLVICHGPKWAAAEDPSDFDRVRSIFEQNCLTCHNSRDRQGDFSLQTKAELLDSGLVEPTDSAASYLLNVVTPQDGEPPSMPRDGTPLSEQQVEDLERWIDAGAVWPDQIRLQEPVVRDFNWWSFQPLRSVPVPAVEEAEWIRTPIDAFVLEAHQQQSLSHSAKADRRTLIRRLTYDLTGLPPTPEQVREFVTDQDPQAYEKLVERLLHSPRYGERWARHWLDVVKYADTCGYDKDKLRPNAWPYRDYVIRSFNQDKPYRRFVQEQVAGDVLFPDDPDGILGLGFVAAGPWDFIGHVEVAESKLDGQVARNLDRDEMVSNTLNTFCSITIQCARCHNHKFDPFTQQHYYNLQSVFAAVDRAERVYDTDPEIEQRRQQLLAEQQQLKLDLKALQDEIDAAGGRRLQDLEERLASLQPKLKAVEKPPEFGFHSQIADDARTEKWVQIQLPRPSAVSKIVLKPCHDSYNNIGAGFGFPVRYLVQIRSPQNPETWRQVADFTDSAVANPGLADVVIEFEQTDVVAIRVTATELVSRQKDFNFALAEVQAFNPDGRNVAAGCDVTASDSIEAPPRWRKSNLTDGLYPVPAYPEAWQQAFLIRQQQQQLLAEILTPARRQRREQLQSRQSELAKELAGLPAGRRVYAAATHFSPQGNFKPTEGVPRTVHVLHRGNIGQLKEPAVPGTVPLHAEDSALFELPDEHHEADRRAALARWITDDDNPLTWRSVANRIWQNHFGVGLVETPNDFGRMGQTPSHPQLLDWLALEFRRTQSFRHLHRLIVLSSTYRQASQHDESNAKIDSNNRFLWRMNRRRLSAEELRDSILAVSGKLDLTMGGPGYYLFEIEKPEHSPQFQYHQFDPNNAASHRRSIYRFVVRSQPDPFMTTLDCADSSQSTPRRTETITALQALSLLNNGFNLAMARHFADDVLRAVAERYDGGSDRHAPQRAAIALAFERITGRPPEADELQRLTQFAEQHGMANVCRLFFNLNEFVFVD